MLSKLLTTSFLCTALLMGTADATAVAVPNRGDGGRCSDSPHYRIRHPYDSGALAELQVNIMACPWSMPDTWTVEAVPGSPDTSSNFYYKVRATVRNEDTTPTYRTVDVDVSLDHCTLGDCFGQGVATWTLEYFLGNDGVYVRRKESTSCHCQYAECGNFLLEELA